MIFAKFQKKMKRPVHYTLTKQQIRPSLAVQTFGQTAHRHEHSRIPSKRTL